MKSSRKSLLLLPALLLAFAFPANAQSPTVKSMNVVRESPGAEYGDANLIGPVDRQGFLMEPFGQWFQENYAEYEPEAALLEQLKPLVENCEITVFMGTWCSDSRRELPRLYRILDALGFQESSLKVYAVGIAPGESMKCPNGEEQGRNIIRVPTIIISRDAKELGRIIEYPVNTLEEDLLAILSGDDYRPNYANASEVNHFLEANGLDAFRAKSDSLAGHFELEGISPDELAGYVAKKLIVPGHLDEAIAVVEMLQKIYPDTASYELSLALIYQHQGKDDLALEHLAKAAGHMEDDEFVRSVAKAIEKVEMSEGE